MAKTITETVNLDALIVREDFDIIGNDIPAGRLGRELYLNNLKSDGQLAIYRKPAFQRETSSWSPEIVAEFIKSVADGDVVPALIMWRSPKSGLTFVIDGAHRLSALVGWINDDFGDGNLSREFYQDSITEQQIVVAKKTRALVEQKVGKYADLVAYVKNAGHAPSPVAVTRGTNLLSTPLSVQPLEGDAQAAEASYKRINSTAVPISETELALIDSRKLPGGIAARALMRAGTGYEYWSHFAEPYKGQIKETAALVYDQLIKPITEYPVRALDLPSSKRGYSANSLKTILDLITILNAPPAGTKTSKIEPDTTGAATVQQLEQVRRVTDRVFGSQHSGSLALHPALYCYDSKGKFVPKAFIGAIEFVREIELKDRFFQFTEGRKTFEEFLIKHSHIMIQLGKSQGSGGRRGVAAVKMLYELLFDGIRRGKTEQEIIDEIRCDKTLGSLEWTLPAEFDSGERFESDIKMGAVISTALAKDICPECGGRLYIKDRSNDHDVRKQDGGKSVASNIKLTHPYCNTGFKEARVAKSKETTKNGH